MSLTLSASWANQCASGITCETVNLAVNGYKEYNYTGAGQGATLAKSGYYKLEVYGAQGGTGRDDYAGGEGGYSYGNLYVSSGTILYIYVGGAGNSTGLGYNGGGSEGNNYSGGGATHIATTSGKLSELNDNQSAVKIVAGGGGYNNYYGGSDGGRPGTGGGTEGSSGGRGIGCSSSGVSYANGGEGGTQSAAGSAGTAWGNYSSTSGESRSFGKGADKIYPGGGGWYGGGGGGTSWGTTSIGCPARGGGGGGSGYIGGVSNGSTSNGGRTGNGYAKITYLGASV